MKGLVLLPLMVAAPVCAQQSSSTQTDIVESLTVTEIDGLDFGLIIPSTAAGNISINRNNGNCSDNGGATLVSGCHRGEFAVSGPSRQRVRVTFDAAPIVLSRQGGGATMSMDRMRINAGQNKRLNVAGQLTFYMSGRLVVGANQMAGLYEGTYNVTVENR